MVPREAGWPAPGRPAGPRLPGVAPAPTRPLAPAGPACFRGCPTTPSRTRAVLPTCEAGCARPAPPPPRGRFAPSAVLQPVVVEDGPGAGGNQHAIGEAVLFDAAKGVEHAGGTGIVRLARGEPGSACHSQRRLVALVHSLPGETLRHGQGPRLDFIAGTAELATGADEHVGPAHRALDHKVDAALLRCGDQLLDPTSAVVVSVARRTQWIGLLQPLIGRMEGPQVVAVNDDRGSACLQLDLRVSQEPGLAGTWLAAKDYGNGHTPGPGHRDHVGQHAPLEDVLVLVVRQRKAQPVILAGHLRRRGEGACPGVQPRTEPRCERGGPNARSRPRPGPVRGSSGFGAARRARGL